MMLHLIYLVAFVGLSSSRKCVYKHCKEASPNKLNVHIVAHTHNDVGWVRTVDQYYFGNESPKGIFREGVQHILNSVVEELLVNKKRKFTYVETAFFWKWFIRQSAKKQEDVRMLVQKGRLQFAGGAWSMNDEATTHYQCIIDQFTHGIRKLNFTFGPCGIPTAGWQVDPFGHSREFASLVAAMGYDGLFLGRIDYEDFQARQERRHLEMLWRGDDDLGNRSDIFTSVLFNLYQPPPNFCTQNCHDMKRQVEDFIEWVQLQAKYYTTNNILVTMGGDFAFTNAGMWFRNLDQVIEQTNLKSNKDNLDLNVFYSTPGCYLKAVKNAMPILPTKQDDFFPYASEPKAYWTGFYTSRPTLKYFVRQANTIFQMMMQLQVLADLDEENQLIIDNFASAMGVLQHHDAIAGTSKQYVVDDYIRILSQAIDQALPMFNQAYHKLSGFYGSESVLTFELCALNESRCDVSENTNQFVVGIYNTLPWQRHHVLRIPVGSKSTFTVKSSTGEIVKSELQEIFKGFDKISNRVIVAEYELVFAVKLIPLGYKAYYIFDNERSKRHAPKKHNSNIVDTTGYSLHSRHGYVLEHGAKFYPAVGKTEYKHHVIKSRPSGAYIFHPKTPHATPLTRLHSSTRQTFFAEEQLNVLTHNFSYIIRSNKNSYLPYDEMEWQIGPIDVKDKVGKEYVITHKVNIKNKGVFHTDSNGRQMIKRIVNKRPQWNTTMSDPVSGNYYPITNEISIENDSVRLIVLTDRSCGGTSLNEGEIEIMVHRRLLVDDGFGVNEALNEIENGLGVVVRGTHKFLIVPTAYKTLNAAAAIRRLEIEAQYDPVVLVADAVDLEYPKWLTLKNTYTGIRTLDVGVNILTLGPWRDNLLLLRLENILSKEMRLDDKYLVRAVDIANIFRDIIIISVKETLLAVNGWKDKYHRWEWMTENEFNPGFEEDSDSKMDKPESLNSNAKAEHGSLIVYLRPKQIRTFLVNYRMANYHS